MKSFFGTVQPRSLVHSRRTRKALRKWAERGYLDNAPQIVKESVFLNYGIPGAAWVETGTFRGDTTEFLRKRFSHVYSIEPGEDLFRAASARFQGVNVTLFNDVSEKVFPELLPTLSGDLNFWLDGHYSAGSTFQGSKDCPVEDELAAIEKALPNLSRVTVLIDDVRCFLASNSRYPDYPTLDYLVDWARKHDFEWRIEHDIFIMQNSG